MDLRHQVNLLKDSYRRQTIIPSKSKIEIPIQLTFFEEIDAIGPNVAMGYFYELITSALYGGKVVTTCIDLKEEPNWYEEEDEEIIKPDVICNNKKIIFESKACRSGHYLNLWDTQVSKYKGMQLLKKDYKIYYAIYRHDFKRINKYCGSMKTLYENLVTSTILSVVLPFSIVLKLHEFCGYSIIGRRYDDYGYGARIGCSTVRSPAINRFFIEPENILEELDLKPESFIFKRYISPFRFFLNDKRILAFPIIWVEDKDHDKWLEEAFMEEFKDIPF